MKAQKQVNKAEAESIVAIAQLRLELAESHAFNEEAKKLHAQQSAEIDTLQVALANETVNVENERNAKQEALKER